MTREVFCDKTLRRGTKKFIQLLNLFVINVLVPKRDCLFKHFCGLFCYVGMNDSNTTYQKNDTFHDRKMLNAPYVVTT